MKLPNPFVIGSGPPGTNYTARVWTQSCTGLLHRRKAERSVLGLIRQVMKKAFDEGWGGVICKTLSLDSSKVVNVTPRYAKLTLPGALKRAWHARGVAPLGAGVSAVPFLAFPRNRAATSPAVSFPLLCQAPARCSGGATSSSSPTENSR